MFNCFHPIYFPIWLPQQCSRGTKNGGADKKVSYIFVLIPRYPISYLTIAGDGFFWGGAYGSLPDAEIWWCLRTGGGGVLTSQLMLPNNTGAHQPDMVDTMMVIPGEKIWYHTHPKRGMNMDPDDACINRASGLSIPDTDWPPCVFLCDWYLLCWLMSRILSLSCRCVSLPSPRFFWNRTSSCLYSNSSISDLPQRNSH